MNILTAFTVIVLIFSLLIHNYQRILRSLSRKVNDPEYTRIIESFISSVENEDIQGGINSLNAAISLVSGAPVGMTYPAVRYLGEKCLCSICQEDIDRNENVIYLRCGHLGHDACLSRWLREQRRCPNCNAPV